MAAAKVDREESSTYDERATPNAADTARLGELRAERSASRSDVSEFGPSSVKISL